MSWSELWVLTGGVRDLRVGCGHFSVGSWGVSWLWISVAGLEVIKLGEWLSLGLVSLISELLAYSHHVFLLWFRSLIAWMLRVKFVSRESVEQLWSQAMLNLSNHVLHLPFLCPIVRCE